MSRNLVSSSYFRSSSPQPDSGMHRRSPPLLKRASSMEDLRGEFDKIIGGQNINSARMMEDFTWDKMGAKVQDFLEKKASESSVEFRDGKPYYPPSKRRKNKADMPVNINGQIIPRKDALLFELVFNDKTNIKSQLETCQQPVIGLEFVTEYVCPGEGAPTVYHCSLCNQFNSCASVMEHITGYNHRVRYIAKKYPNQAKTYLLPGTTRANRNPQLMKMAQGRCQELELVYGRGMYTVKHEKPVIPEGKLDFEDDMINVTLGQQTEVLKYILRKIKEITLETDEDVRIAKQIINDLTDAIIEFKQSKSNDEMSKTTAGFMQQGGMVAQHSRSLYN